MEWTGCGSFSFLFPCCFIHCCLHLRLLSLSVGRRCRSVVCPTNLLPFCCIPGSVFRLPLLLRESWLSSLTISSSSYRTETVRLYFISVCELFWLSPSVVHVLQLCCLDSKLCTNLNRSSPSRDQPRITHAVIAFTALFGCHAHGCLT